MRAKPVGSSGDELTRFMRQATGSGMFGESGQQHGVLTDVITYAHMPFGRIEAARAKRLTPIEEKRMANYDDFLDLALRPAESVNAQWLRGFGSTPDDIAPNLKKRYEQAQRVWKARELHSKSLVKEPSDGVRDWMKRLDLSFEDLQNAVVDPFQHEHNKDFYIPVDEVVRLSDAGLFGIGIPEKYGGLGFKQKEIDRVLNRLCGKVSGGIGGGLVNANRTIGAKPILMYGSDEQKEYYLPKIAEGKFLCAFGLTEEGSGTDAIRRQKTTVRLSKDKTKWVFDTKGGKLFITNVHRSGIFFASVNVDDGSGVPKPSVLIIETPFRITDTPEEIDQKREELKKKGLYISKPLDLMMIKGSNQAYIEFGNEDESVNYELPVVNKDGIPALLGDVGDGARIIFNSLNSGRAGLGGYCAGYSEHGLNLACEEAVVRPRFEEFKIIDPEFGGTLAGLPDVQMHVTKAAIKTEVIKAVSHLTNSLIDAYPDMNIISEAAITKSLAADEAWDVIQIATKLFGGKGTMKGQPIELIFRDAWITPIIEGVHPALKMQAIANAARLADKERKSLAGAWRLLKSRFNYEMGQLNFADSYRIQRNAHSLSFRTMWLGFRAGRKIPFKQHELLDLADRAIDLYILTAVLYRLQDRVDPPSLREKAALEQYVINKTHILPWKKEEYPDWIGRMYLKAAKERVEKRRQEDERLVRAYGT